MQNVATAAAMFVILAIAAYFIVPANKYRRLYISLALFSVILRLATVAYLYSKGVDTFGTDGLLYHRIGKWVCNQLNIGIPVYSVKYIYTWYTVIVGIVYHLFGINRFIVSYINIVLAFFSALLLFKIALGLKYRFSNAAFISLAFLYFPNLILWTSDSRKEALTIFICVLCFYCMQHFLLKMCPAGPSAKTAAGLPASGIACPDTAWYGTASGTGNAADHHTAAGKENPVPGAHENKKLHIPANISANIRIGCIIAFLCVLMWFGTLIRIYLFIPIALGILLSLLIFYLRNPRRVYLVFGTAVIISSLIIFFFTVCPHLKSYHAVTFPEEIGDFSTDMANKVETIKLMASSRNILLTALNYFILPYPGNTGIAEISGSIVLNAIVSADMIFWYACMLLMIPGIAEAIKNKESFLLGLLAFLTAYNVINIIAVENVPDTIYRYRSVTIGISLLFTDWSIISRTWSRIGSQMLRQQPAKPDLTPNNHWGNNS